ncbi:MAG: circularly permuted type 2 ATP-grasp protein [Vicinamibacterales bacterium]
MSLLDDYRVRAGVFDEAFETGNRLRPFCAPLFTSLDALGRHELASRWENARRTIRDNGVTYNVYGDPAGSDRPWTLDMVPLPIGAREWIRIEAGLVQRARLLNTILADLYGPMRLVEDGTLPPSLVHANPAFLRPCHGTPVPGGIHLHLLAVDLARSPDGEWRVLSDRAQAPSGAGYALENRIVLSRGLPEAFRECQVPQLSSFFRAHRDGLARLAPPLTRDPRVVLLTPGPLNETYFEHAYLARYLGFTLVEGGDLTCRDGRVFIKTLDGLQPVDVILRRLDDGYCDPLELRSDSTLGVAGLVEAARAGHVTVANALGSGLIESPGLAAFFPELCRRLLGEELLLQPARSWWCGHPDELTYALEHAADLVFKRSLPGSASPPIFGRMLTRDQVKSLRAALRARPEDFVAQREVVLSVAPSWSGQGFHPRQVVLRAYVAVSGDSWVVMPGGLTRTGIDDGEPIVSMQRGGGSKDTWVIGDTPPKAVSLLPPADVRVRRESRGTDLPSRVADNLFWLGRQVERAEQTVRLLRSFVTAVTREDMTARTPETDSLERLLVDLGAWPADATGSGPDLASFEATLAELFSHDGQAGALRGPLADIRRIAMSVRDRLSLDTWRILSQLETGATLRRGRVQVDDVLRHLNLLVTNLAAFSGMEMENMTRGYSWRFLDMGRRLERALATTALVRSALTVATPITRVLASLLEIADSGMTYRRRYFAEPQLPPVLDLLLGDGSNTRALAFQLSALTDHLAQLPHEDAASQIMQQPALIADVTARLDQADFGDLGRPSEDAGYAPLFALIDLADQRVRGLSDALAASYFSHAEVRVSQ